MSLRQQFPRDQAVQVLAERAPRGIQYGMVPAKWDVIINGKVFSSKTSLGLAIYQEHSPAYAYRLEELLKTVDGEYLLVGEGKQCSPWAKKLPDCENYVMGHAFVPVSIDDAKLWLELRGKDEEYLEHFGNPKRGLEVKT